MKLTWWFVGFCSGIAAAVVAAVIAVLVVAWGE